MSHEDQPNNESHEDSVPIPMLVIRSVIGGIFMGLANLVPGISGGTMLLASGVYPRFIQAIAELSTFKFRLRSIAVLAAVVLAALMSIGLLAGGVKELVVNHRWIMYSLFIGLTLGGVPVIWRMIGSPNRAVWISAAVGFLGMAAIGWMQAQGATGVGERSGFAFMLVAGVVAASAMILPGISGGYLFLVMGVYLPILGGIQALKNAVSARDFAAAMEPGMNVVLPVGIGVLVGVVGVSNLLKWLLNRYEKATLGVLLGLLVGAVAGLWPFQQPVEPVPGDIIKGIVQTVETIAELDKDDYPTTYFRPTIIQVAGAFGLIVVGLGVTVLVSKVGGGSKEHGS